MTTSGHRDLPSNQVIAERHGQNPLVIGYQANESPSVLRNYCSWAGSRVPNPASLPHEAFDEIFGAGLPASPGGPATPNPQDVARRQRRRSILDFIAGEITATRQSLPLADRFVLDAHLDGIRDLEMRLADDTPAVVAGAGCAEPSVDNVDEGSRGSQFPLLVELSNAVAVMAVRCDLRRSLVLQYGSCANHFIYPRWPSNKYYPIDITTVPSGQPNNSWHSIAHSGRTDYRIEMETFMMHVFKEVLDGLDEFQEASGETHLDNSVCLWMRAMGSGHDRTNNRFALLLGGGGGRLRGNLYYDTGGDEDNDVLVTCMQACGFDDDTFGDSDLCHGAYPVLTGV